MKMPVLFVGHGSPMNAIEKNGWTETLNHLGKILPKPKAIACISAHWVTRGTKVLTVEEPKTIHDFRGFPQELFDIEYPAPGSPEFAQKTLELLKPFRALGDHQWGLDHGAWSILVHLYPAADIPVYQISLDLGLNEKAHMEIGKALRPLREEGVLILGTGNIVHNLRQMRAEGAAPQPWAVEFDEKIMQALMKRDQDSLLFHKQKFNEASALSVPTDEHYWPLLYCYGASEESDKVQFPFEGHSMGSLSMRTVLWTS